jgi:hypothetical protein
LTITQGPAMYGTDRSAMRRVFVEAWRKHQAGMPLEPLERVIAEVVIEHPEYHRLLEAPEAVLEQDFSPESGGGNPFLHLAMHLTLREQLATDRPPRIADLHHRLCARTGDAHEAEHELMECLAEMIWESQRAQRPPDQQAYLGCVQKRLQKLSAAPK